VEGVPSAFPRRSGAPSALLPPLLAAMRTPIRQGQTWPRARLGGELSRLVTGGSSYSLTLGARLKGLLGDARVDRAARALTDFASRYGKAGRAAAKHGPKLAKYHSEIVDIIKLFGMNLDAAEPQVITLDSPVGGFGVEIGWQFVVSEYHVVARW
jgi:hypothetical protein